MGEGWGVGRVNKTQKKKVKLQSKKTQNYYVHACAAAQSNLFLSKYDFQRK
jgi:hypothetical protein